MNKSTENLHKFGAYADRIGHWSDGPETFVVVKAKDVQVGSQTYGPPQVATAVTSMSLKLAAPAPAPIAAPAPTAVPRDALEPVALITTAVLGEHLGIAVNADLIASLGFTGTKLSKPGTYWPESDIPAIRAALIEHIRNHRRA